MQIHEDSNGLRVNAISTDESGKNVEGTLYQVLAGEETLELKFQDGGVQENGVNGLTNEALLSVLIHRVNNLNAKFPSKENDTALNCMDHALNSLEARTYRRQVRGVEGQEIS